MIKRDASGKFIKGNKAWLGKKRPGVITKTAFKKGFTPWNKGMKMSNEHCDKLSKSQYNVKHLNARGKKHYRYKGGPINRDSLDYRNWRRAVFERDDYTCQECCKRGGGVLHAHHIKPRYKYPELIFDVDNGQTLCIKCHRLTPSYGRIKKTN